MTAKEYLSQARTIIIKLEAMAEQLKFLRSAAEYSPQQFSGMPNPPRNIRKAENAYIRVMEKEEQIKLAQDELNKIAAVITGVGDPTLEFILSKRYLSAKKWGEISRESRYSVSHIYELHRDALAAVEVILKVRSKT